MKAVILAGGLGTRISEETGVRPKRMIDVGTSKMTGVCIRRIPDQTGEEDICFTVGIGAGDVVKRVLACSSR